MKWGIRKYVDENGNLTDAGKKKYGTVDRAQKSEGRKYVARRAILTGAATAGSVAVQNVISAKAHGEEINGSKIAMNAALRGALATSGVAMQSRGIKQRYINTGKVTTRDILEATATVGTMTASDYVLHHMDEIAGALNKPSLKSSRPTSGQTNHEGKVFDDFYGWQTPEKLKELNDADARIEEYLNKHPEKR